ncbi:MAG TPA: N,N-dimethylformamidase beta subunit family domain-containing protein [Thermoanaerobaculia bacterium]|jgi:hypothetical protein
MTKSIFRAATAALLLASILAPAAAARRRAVQSPPPATNPLYTQGGYADRMSVLQGGTIAFHISSGVAPFTLQIVNLVQPDTVLATIPNLTAPVRDCTGLYDVGCKWPVTATFTIPASWPSGYYAARIPTTGGTRSIFFVVRAAHPSAPILMIAATNTYQAYNAFGNRSVYPSNSPERSFKVSFDRPFAEADGLGRFPRWEQFFAQWMKSENRPFDLATDSDLEDPTLLTPYRVVVIAGHSEYWTKTARENLERYSANGGHIAIFGGNTMWWQARLENDGRTLVVYKAAAPDPENGKHDDIVTVNWFDEPVNRPENLITGASFRYGGYVNRGVALTAPRIGYTVTDPTSWVYEGLTVTAGTPFGAIAAGEESDGALFNCGGNALAAAVDGSDGTPRNFHIVATVPAAAGYGTVGYYVNAMGGAVFNAGTQNWPVALATDPVVQTITRNVLNRFLAGPLVYDPVSDPARTRDTFNCPLPAADVIPGWRGEEGKAQPTARCAYEGPTGLDLHGDPRVLLARNFAPTFNTTSTVNLRLYVNADNMTRTDAAFGFLTLQLRKNRVNSRVARIDVDPATKSVRIVTFLANGNTASRGDWIALGSGWHSLQMSWHSPGAVTLQVDSGAVSTLQNSDATQVVNEAQLFYPAAESAGSTAYLCVDAFAAGVEPQPAVAPLH